jgi:hypothetical protein
MASKSRHDLLLDAALAVAVFAASLGLLAAGHEWEGGGDVDALGVLLTALASLPLVAWRRAPLAVFVVTAVASTVLKGFWEPGGPPIGPIVALYFVALTGDGSRARTRLTLAIAGVLLVAHLTATGLAEHRFPAWRSFSAS